MNFNTIINIGETFVADIINQIDQQGSDLWNQIPIRTTLKGGPFSDCEDIVLQYQNVMADPTKMDHLETISYAPFETLFLVKQYVFALMSTVQGERLGRVMVTKLKPGGKILPHADSKLFSDYYNRFQLCLKTNSDVVFRCGDEYLSHNVGDVFWFDNSKEHEVINNGTTDRWAVIVDIKKPAVFCGTYIHTDLELVEDEAGNYVSVAKEAPKKPLAVRGCSYSDMIIEHEIIDGCSMLAGGEML